MADNDKLKEGILERHYANFNKRIGYPINVFNAMEEYAKAYHLARLGAITSSDIDEMANNYGDLNQSQWVGFTWGAKAVLEKLKQSNNQTVEPQKPDTK